MNYYAHIKGESTTLPLSRPNQFLSDHLLNVALLSRNFAKKIELKHSGHLIGLLHDLGKFSKTFQKYIRSVANLISTEDLEYVDIHGMKGKIDHATAGAQWIWNHQSNDTISCFSAQILALCVASHHGGLIDCLSPDGAEKFLNRISKEDTRTFLCEVQKNISEDQTRLLALLASAKNEIHAKCVDIAQHANDNELTNAFAQGLLTRFLLSCLIDADRLDSAGRDQSNQANWTSLVECFETEFLKLTNDTKLGQVRGTIARTCRKSSERDPGIYFLTIPTGGGKTLASFRFALHHAKKHNLQRIIYVIPYTSIIEQNAKVIREFLASFEDIILEHHSNLIPEEDTEKNRLLTENWDSPIIFTTSVQLLETLFASGTRGLRRMHNLARSVIIFDEPQSLPLKVTHMLNNALNFLHEQCDSTIVLCTATQPLFHQVSKVYGTLNINQPEAEIVPNKHDFFQTLVRVSVLNKCKPEGYSYDEITTLISQISQACESILFVANTKTVAREIFQRCRDSLPQISVYHLSTNMCPAHRRDILEKIKSKVAQERLICISTQLIEAGVDISFRCVLRSLAGLDSIAQAAGRCNRHNESTIPGEVLIINPRDENLSSLTEIRIAQQKTERVLREYETNPDAFDRDLIGLKAINRYYELYFFERAHEMVYPINGDSLLSQLSENKLAVREYQRKSSDQKSPPIFLRQSFKSAGKAFEVIDAPTEGVIVPYNDDARSLIGELCSMQWNPQRTLALIKRAQRYSVNIFSSDKAKLQDQKAIYETQPDSGIFCLQDPFYSATYGLSVEGKGQWGFQGI